MRSNRLLMLLGVGIGFVGGWFAHQYVMVTRPLSEIQESFQRGQFELCLNLANRRLRETGDSDKNAMLLAARAHIELRHWQDAIRLYRQLLIRSEDDFINLARAYFAIKNSDGALQACEDGLKHMGETARLLELQARLLASMNLHARALAATEKLRRFPGRELAADLVAGLINYSSGNYRESSKYLLAALERSPNLEGQSPDLPATSRADVVQFLADSYRNTEQYEKAEHFGEEWHQLVGLPDSAYFVSKCARERGDLKKQETWINKTLLIKDNYVAALADLASIRLGQRQMDQAKSLANRVLGIEPENVIAKRVQDAVSRLERQATQDAKAGSS